MRFSVTATALGFAAVCGLVAAAPTAVSSAQPYEETNAEQSLPFSPGPITTTTVFDDEHGFRNISYFVKDGDVIVESDIIFGTVQDLRQGEANAQKAMESGVQIARRAYVKVNLPWYGATVRYKWATPGSKANYKNEVEDAIARWKANASYLHFQEVGTGYNGDQWNPVLTIYGEGEIGCFSSVGYTPGVTSRMQLGTGCGTAEATHEFGHVLGLQHEHIRPDRDDHVNIHWNNIISEDVQWFNKGPDPDSTSDWSSPYDIKSIMHYRTNAFGIDGAVVMGSKDPNHPVSDRSGDYPSEGDFRAICGIYTCECPGAARPNGCPARTEQE